MNIFLDLEETIIKDWYTPNLLSDKIEFIKKEITSIERRFEEKVTKVIILSFAIINDIDLEIFERTLRFEIENALNLKIDDIWICSKENLFELSRKRGVEPLAGDSVHELFLGNQKEEIFELITMNNFKEEISVLFDDTVTNSIKSIFGEELLKGKSTTQIMIRV